MQKSYLPQGLMNVIQLIAYWQIPGFFTLIKVKDFSFRGQYCPQFRNFYVACSWQLSLQHFAVFFNGSGSLNFRSGAFASEHPSVFGHNAITRYINIQK